jgi:hypothetical protein
MTGFWNNLHQVRSLIVDRLGSPRVSDIPVKGEQMRDVILIISGFVTRVTRRMPLEPFRST